MSWLFTPTKFLNRRIAKSRQIKEDSYSVLFRKTIRGDETALRTIKTANQIADLYKANYGVTDDLETMKVLVLSYALGAQKAHEDSHLILAKSLSVMSCSKCGTSHTRQDVVTCRCGQKLYDNKTEEE